VASPPLNPYAPPKAADPPAEPLVFGDFDIGRAINDAWEACKRHFPLWLGVLVVGGILVFLSAITFIGCFVAVPVFGWGFGKFFLNMADGKPSFDDLFAGFKNYLPVLGRMLLLIVILVLLGFISESLVFVGKFTDSLVVTLVGWLIYLVVRCTVIVRLYFSFFLAIDRDMGAIESLANSWRMTQGKVMKTIGLGLLSVLISGAGVLACFVGVFFTATMAYVMYASAYRQMVGPAMREAIG